MGFSFLREFGVLLAAILLAGRSASAFAAQIGSMKSNEEVDAIRTLGLSPIELLVLPRVLAMLITLPILTFVGMLSGIAGGLVVCVTALDISPTMFFNIMARDIAVSHFLVGLAKAPVFAFVIAVIGCTEGFKVTGSANQLASTPLQAWSGDLHGDPAGCHRRAVLHGDGLVTGNDALIQVRGLVNRFGNQTVHDGLDTDIRRGEILGVVGGSGTGKSVLLRSIVGLRRPNAGSVSVFGENLLELSAERRSQVERRFGVLFSGARCSPR